MQQLKEIIMADSAPRRGCFFPFLFLLSILLNIGLLAYFFWPTAESDEPEVIEKHLYGSKTQSNKIAVIRAEGALAEGLDGHILRQIEQAGRDSHVKGVVLRVDSPGGTVGSSEHIHRELTRLRSGQHPRYKDWSAKPLVVSMGSIAASGGYYISMPAEKVFAEKGTLTGSIGVFAALPNVSELTQRNGIHLQFIKQGAIKGSGSPFNELSPAERQPWQDMVDSAYDQFLDVVVAGRPKLNKQQLRSDIVMKKQANLYDDRGNVIKDDKGQAKQVEVSRYRADGGTFTAAEAKELGLIDDIGLLEDAVAATASSAGVSDYRVIAYQRPPTLLTALLGIREPATQPSVQQISEGLRPRIWYLAPGSEVSGIVAATGK
jgi:protease IV